MTRPDPAQDAALGSLGDQMQSLLDAHDLDVIGFVVMVDVGDGIIGFESRARIGTEEFRSLLARRARSM